MPPVRCTCGANLSMIFAQIYFDNKTPSDFQLKRQCCKMKILCDIPIKKIAKGIIIPN